MPGWDVLSIAERLNSLPRYSGKGVCIAFVDLGFYAHPDLMRPEKRIRSYVDVTRPEPVSSELFTANPHAWHGTMTACCAAGSGYLSGGRYRGLAYDSDVVLIKAGTDGKIRAKDIALAIRAPLRYPQLGIRVMNVSIGIDPDDPHIGDVADAVREVTRAGITVIAAAGNAPGVAPQLPASAPEVLAIGGLDDNNTLDDGDDATWPSSHGDGVHGIQKPELIAPAVWLAAPVLPGTIVAREGSALFTLRALLEEESLEMRFGSAQREIDADEDASLIATIEAIEARIARGRYVTPHYQRVQGTSFAAPITTSVVAQMLQANPSLTPMDVRQGLIRTARALAGTPRNVQGAGVLQPREAVEWALAHGK